MVYIHGGEFQRGASNTFPAHIMAVFYKVVVVTINYRLGALGQFQLPFIDITHAVSTKQPFLPQLSLRCLFASQDV